MATCTGGVKFRGKEWLATCSCDENREVHGGRRLRGGGGVQVEGNSTDKVRVFSGLGLL